jgi:soluble lytic murein transglycosylase-like protein
VSTQPLSGVPAGELALMQRVQQLQTLIESARQVASGMPASALSGASAAQGSDAPTSATDFASALQAATTADAVGAAEPNGVLGSSGVPGYQGAGATTDVAYAAAPQGATAGGEGEGASYEALVDQAAARNGLDPAVLHGLIQQESGFDPTATSSAGAAGLTQLMPGTASSLGVADPLDPAESIEGGARYLGEMMSRFGGNTADALAAYNAGPGAVQQYGGVPPYAETETYVSKVLGYAESYRQSHPETTGALL